MLCLFFIKDFKIPSNTALKTPLVAVFEDLDIEVEEEDELKARGKGSLFCQHHSVWHCPFIKNCIMRSSKYKALLVELRGNN